MRGGIVCASCGCKQPHNRHGHPDNITIDDIDDAARVINSSRFVVAKNILDVVNLLPKGSTANLLESPDVSIDVDGTLALTSHALVAAVNAKCGTQYTYFDGEAAFTGKAQKFADKIQSGDDFALTSGFYASVAPDYAAVAAVRAMHDAGIYVHISTFRDAEYEDSTRWWLDKWEIPYDALHVGNGSKVQLADQYASKGHPLIFVDDSPKLLDKVTQPGAFIYLLRRPYLGDVPMFGDNWCVIDTWRAVLTRLGVTTLTEEVPQLDLPIANKQASNVIAAGLAIVARDTGRVLMIQRALDDSDPASGKWEFPGGHLESDELPLYAAMREFSEEVGCMLPAGEVQAIWDSATGIYRLFVYVVDHESDVAINAEHDFRTVLNPDDPDGDNIEVAAWWSVSDLATLPALREEAKATPWSMLRVDSATAGTDNQ